MRIHRATVLESEAAYSIVSEYYEAVDVLVRDDRSAFEREYFAKDAGIWLATDNDEIIGCIALHRLPNLDNGGEIKRLYVRHSHRGQGVAADLLAALEAYAEGQGYAALYLDSKDDLMPAIRFYQRQGYLPCERYNDNPQATIFMCKRLV